MKFRLSLAVLVLTGGRMLALETASPPLPENLALKAKATASSEHNGSYRARFAIDGKVPSAGSQEDTDRAWCVQGNTHRHGADFTLEWTSAVTVAEVVYWGRTAWFAEECWKDYELWSGGVSSGTSPLAQGQFQMGHGPQRIRLSTPVTTRKLTLKFTSSYGGLNPGASEIQVFATSPSENALAKFRPLPKGRPELIDDEIKESLELAAKLAEGKLDFNKLLLIQRRELNPSHVYTYHVEGFGAGGGLAICDRLSAISAPSLRQLVASPDGQILDCDLSYDTKEILFSWRKTQHEGYQVFVINADGSGLEQLTDGPHHNYNACWLPDGGIAFLSTRAARFAYCWISPVGILHRMERDGSGVTQLSANIVNDFTPSVLADGRLIYSRWEYVDKPAIPVQSLWTIHPDGTGLAGFFGNRVLSPATFMEARSIPGSSKVLCVLTSHNGPCRGAIGTIDTSFGNNAQAGIENLTPEVNIGRVDKGDGNNIRGPYESPYPLDRDYFLVSKRGTVLVRNYAGTQTATVLRPKDGLGFYSPQPLRPRTKPPVLASGTGVTPVSILSSDSRDGRDARPTSKVEWATVVLQDVYRGLEPQVKRGEVKEICVVEEMHKVVRTDVASRHFGFQFPVISCGATYAAKRVWGYAPVAPDGSACFQVPAGRPVYFMALDAQGRAVQRMRTFTHMMPGEIQGCVGCHEPRQQANAVGRASPPASELAAITPAQLRPPEWGDAVGFDYARVVQPVLDAHCGKCHSGVTPAARVDLCGDATDFFNVSYEFLARGRKRSGEAEWDSPYVNWIPTYNGMEQNILEVTPKAWGSPRSKLADVLLSGHPETNGAPRLKMEAREIRRVLAWIDLNVPYYGTSETAYPEKRGCRQLLPDDLDKTLADVGQRRCAGCHDGGKFPRQFWTRIVNPHRNNFLLAPLAKEAGGSGACGKPVFQDATDPDYQAILKTFEPITAMLRVRPRLDMPGGKPADVDRSCLGKLN
ncbi:MAG: discoidin domain-containing protein [Verrucomicrobia bacterium]|nr:discoidin domain-containing protein [Verrucomicrobiota bacterium]